MKSPIPLKEALDKIKRIKNNCYFRRAIEKVNLIDSVGREHGETIFADFMSPQFNIAAMDGFAGRAYAGDRIAEIEPGKAMAIATGQSCRRALMPCLKLRMLSLKKSFYMVKS